MILNNQFGNRKNSFDLDAAAVLDEAWNLACTGRSIRAFSLANSVLTSAEQRGDQGLVARGSQQCAWYCFQLGETETGLVYAEKALSLWKQLEEPALEAEAISIAAWLHLELGNLEQAVEFAAEAMNIADQSRNLRCRSLAINVIGVIFWMTRQPSLAVDYCARAVELAREAHDLTFECWWLINLGGAHAEDAYLVQEADNQKFETSISSAIDVTKQALSLAQLLKDAWAERLCIANLAEYFNAVENFSAAEMLLERYRDIPGDDYVRGEGHYLVTLGSTLVSLKRYEEALVPLEQAHLLAGENFNLETLMHACLSLSKAHEYLEAFEFALDFHKKYHKLHQQFTAERIQQNARMAEIRYETKKLKAMLDTEAERSAEIARSLEALQQQTNVLTEAANTDPLTGLSNRRHLETIISDVNTQGASYALAILDVDYFKTINDTFSHIIGDRVLVQIGALVKIVVRETDLAVRFGGEEFVILMTDLTLAHAERVSERLRMTITNFDWSEIADGLNVSVSIGVAMSDDAVDAEAVLQLADRRLYWAKQTGRNRVVCFLPSGNRFEQTTSAITD
ncbi:diguanylate cyclase [Agrobacterium vitis]|uniref:diguanylate cyclase n=1 Tax=Agrobacterium vitis TaxID=373 RepID=A0A368NNG4_AGRVI|nr:tetratricopeptide repeat-containing diguanylate cyclase [Agrobacterium vitis]KAA3509734.1 GGDEF domain-containing protein [Agrobacterium vitis]KAA3523357.1 GGDEF domain-containing protein [Agrobacterium vitis]MCF1479127.1 GGDEF domain-containing protein [Agrobacterium vitis]MUZ98577.1 diguanylate cyclase [Agrobacterium vitis]MVA30915.1 diguanylate cyclase [Agrobacterium vitis]